MSFKDDVRDAVREVLREELAKLQPAANRPDSLQWYTPEEVAKRTCFSADTVRDYCAKGKLRATKKGGNWRVRATDLEAFMRSSEQAENAPDPREAAFALVNGKR